MNKRYITKDSGKRELFKSGMVRDFDSDKPRFDLIIPLGQKYEDTLLYRLAMLMNRGTKKYSERNWEKANSREELDRAKSSAFRHFMQWFCEEEDEDHASSLFFNIIEAELIKQKIKNLGVKLKTR
jgi:hypothetical protein